VSRRYKGRAMMWQTHYRAQRAPWVECRMAGPELTSTRGQVRGSVDKVPRGWPKAHLYEEVGPEYVGVVSHVVLRPQSPGGEGSDVPTGESPFESSRTHPYTRGRSGGAVGTGPCGGSKAHRNSGSLQVQGHATPDD
jgi:hypothetical protein